ncbi:hypothetical protein GALMADRAFT_148679 [Galerina marginata CBS 339.88]|uniref:Uncharacterized protein n=1 Tax=Galerina marginata (strain CBS 339.88) TaxID=685588 RepID=A0A067SCM9_GALM3|nr:hypothetical protein GALMADRAFT_148679 [Galerina marginata CBS 339.88]
MANAPCAPQVQTLPPPPTASSSSPNLKKVYFPVHPDHLPRAVSPDGRYFIVTRAQDAGVFVRWNDVFKRISSVDGAIYEKRATLEDAIFTYSAAFYEGTISIEPVPGGPFDHNAVYVPVVPRNYGPGPHTYFIPHPQELERPQSCVKIYVVIKGEGVGAFGTWHQVAVRIQNVKNRACFFKVDSWEEAVEIYTNAFNAHPRQVEVFPVPGGLFDNPVFVEEGEESDAEDAVNEEELQYQFGNYA